ncbi:MAG TPA: hypothetical protein VGM98_06885 [Schlesneria sp.]
MLLLTGDQQFRMIILREDQPVDVIVREQRQGVAVVEIRRFDSNRFDSSYTSLPAKLGPVTSMASQSQSRIAIPLISYWTIVTPLTLLSVCLLLWNPRRRA